MEPIKTVEITEVFEQNKLRDFAFYECGFLHKTILPYLTDEQELFLLVNDDLHRKGKYTSDDFIISLDEIWHFLGYNQKAKAKRVLEEHFILNKDYKIIASNQHVDKTVKCKQCRGGHNKEKIVMNLKTYNLFCLKSNTPFAHKIQEYYLGLEQMVIKTLDDECKLFLKRSGLDENGNEITHTIDTTKWEIENSDDEIELGESDDENSDLKSEEPENKFTRSLDDLVIQISCNRSGLSRHLLKNYKENYHFIILKLGKNSDFIKGGHNKITFMLTEFAYELLQNSFNLRNRYIVNMSENFKCINIGMCIENQTIGFIANSFETIVKTERQFIFDKYRVDLFFNDFNLIIECDENNHKDRCVIQEKIRENYLLSLGNTIIRFNPNDSKFELSNVLKEINKLLFFKNEYKEPIVILLP
jgi:very-short-patch-repair endonuclease